MNDRYRLFNQPDLRDTALLVAWNEDAGKTSTRAAEFLMRKLPYRAFVEVEPAEFFPLAGVTVEDNVVQFPESRFYYCPDTKLLIFKSDSPAFEWYRFLDLVLEIAIETCRVKEIYALGSLVSAAAHTNPRQIVAVFNSHPLKAELSAYGLSTELEYKTPPGQRPTLNSFLLWAAKRRNLPGANLWVPSPFYLLGAGDPLGQKTALEFLARRFGLFIDLSELDEEVQRQNVKLAELRSRFPEIDQSITKLESNQGLSEEDNENLVKAVHEFFEGESGQAR